MVSWLGRCVSASSTRQTSRIVLDLNGTAKIGDITPGNPFAVQIISTGPMKVVKLDEKPLIIIDAGHGGQDPGAIGLHGTHEKDVTLNYALALREALLKTGRYRVGMTREDDTCVRDVLQERVAIARKMKGDIFLSFHADSNPRPEARGLSIYTLSENASDDEAAALAERGEQGGCYFRNGFGAKPMRMWRVSSSTSRSARR